MKKGPLAAITGLLIVVALFTYSYYANKDAAPTSVDIETALNDTAQKKEAIPSPSTVPKEEAIPSPSTAPGNAQELSNNAVDKSSLGSTTPPTASNEPVVENKAPLNSGEKIEQAIKNGDSMWLLFRSTTCVPCVEMQKVFDQLEPEYKGKVRFIAIDVNDENNAEVINAWQIRYIPTTFIVDVAAKKITYQNVGVIPVEDLKKELDKVVK